MGNTSDQNQSQLKDKFTYIDTVPTKYFGSTQIYRKNEPFYEYVSFIEKHLENDKVPFIK